MIFTETELHGAYLIDLDKRVDERGYFARSFCQREFAALGLTAQIAQANIATNSRKGTVRGMHFQFPPVAESKVVTCVRGAILDVIVDLRPESPTYLQSLKVTLDDESQRALYVPERFAHGYQSLADDTRVSYLMGSFYQPEEQAGFRFDDASIGSHWPIPIGLVSPRDKDLPRLSDIEPEIRRRMRLVA